MEKQTVSIKRSVATVTFLGVQLCWWAVPLPGRSTSSVIARARSHPPYRVAHGIFRLFRR